jgi:hypothetical protein
MRHQGGKQDQLTACAVPWPHDHVAHRLHCAKPEDSECVIGEVACGKGEENEPACDADLVLEQTQSEA